MMLSAHLQTLSRSLKTNNSSTVSLVLSPATSPFHPFSSVLPHTTGVAILDSCLWLHSIHKPGQRLISQFCRDRPSPNITTSKQISQNKVSVNNTVIRSAAPLPQHKPCPSLQGSVPSEYDVVSAQHPGQSWALIPISAHWSPVLWNVQMIETVTYEIHLNRTAAIRGVQHCTRVYNEADRQAKLALRWQLMSDPGKADRQSHIWDRISSSCKLPETAVCWLCMLRCSQMLTTYISLRDSSKKLQGFSYLSFTSGKYELDGLHVSDCHSLITVPKTAFDTVWR